MRCEFGEGGHEKLLRNWHQDLNRRLEQHWGSFRKPERRPGAGPSAGVFALQLMHGDRLGTFPADLRWALF